MKRNVLKLQKKRQAVAHTVAHARSRAQPPQLTGRETSKRTVLQNFFPIGENFFTGLHMDLILMVRKYVTHPEHSLYALMPLMLTCKTVYNRLCNEKVIVQSIAKDIFGFIHLSLGALQRMHTFQDILAFHHHWNGQLLTHYECKTKQLLGNARLRSKKPFELYMHAIVLDYTSLGRFYQLKCVGRRKEVRQLKKMLVDFEGVHGAIQLKIYKPFYNNCYPCNTENNAIVAQVDSTDWIMHERCLLLEQGERIMVRFHIGLQMYNFYYRFVLIPEQCLPLT